MKCAIVIPIYKTHPTEIERLALLRTSSVLKGYDCYFIQARGSNMARHYSTLEKKFSIHEFSPEYFSGIPGYNRLMMVPEFYSQFLGYDYMLIAQLDAVVFEDRLLSFCESGFDYFGAPWVGYDITKLPKLAPYLSWKYRLRNSRLGKYLLGQTWAVGNGGLSLRRVKSALQVLEKSSTLQTFDVGQFRANEDNFWSFVAPRIDSTFKVAPFPLALDFAFELAPQICFRLNGSRLPFGCHAFEKHEPDFWISQLERREDVEFANALKKVVTSEVSEK